MGIYTKKIAKSPFDEWEKALPKRLAALLKAFVGDASVKLVAGDYQTSSRARGKVHYQVLAIVDTRNAQIYSMDNADEQ